jgi:hypothetical protein
MEKVLQKLKWQAGRQNGSYKKIKLLESKLFAFDCYLLYYPVDSAISSHVDEVQLGNHYRLNIELKKAKEGGHFLLSGKPIFKFWRTVCFRPDKQFHSVSNIKKGYRLVLSIGWVRKNKNRSS